VEGGGGGGGGGGGYFVMVNPISNCNVMAYNMQW